jgi:hypothetical protein
MNNKSILTWLIPVAALAVPGFLFYNWWSTLNATTRAQLEKKVKSNTGLTLFLGGSVKPQLKNPLTPQPAAPVVQSTQTVAGVAKSSQTTVVAVSSGTAVAGANPAAAAAVAQSSAAANGAAAAEAVAIGRDPTLSPYDVVRIETDRMQRENAGHEINAAIRRPEHKPKEPPIEDSIELEGIIGKEVIVNGERYGEGELLMGKVKVLKITPSTVVFIYKNRKFSKSLGQ